MVSLSWIGGFHFCGGSLLTLEFILTACHCLCRYKDDIDEEVVRTTEFFMLSGDIYNEENAYNKKTLQERTPAEIHIHPSCRSRRKGGYYYDYAIVQAIKPFRASPFLQAFRLISLDEGASWKYLVDLVKNRRWCKAVGWGATGISPKGSYVNISSRLRVVGVQLISFAQCHKLLTDFSSAYSSVNVQARFQVCAKNDNRSDACKGDSGGGFVCGSYVFGFLSWGPACGEKNTPSVYAAIDGGWSFIVSVVKNRVERISPATDRLLASSVFVWTIKRLRNI